MTPQQITNLLWITALSGKELAELIGVAEMTVNRWEKGAAEPRDQHLAAMKRLWDAIMGMSDERFSEVYAELRDVEHKVAFWRGFLAAEEAHAA